MRFRRRVGVRVDSGHLLFGGTGWLFADLMVAIAMAFLVATTVGFPPIVHRVGKHPTSSHPIEAPQPALDFNYVTIDLAIDPTGLLNQEPAVTASIGSQILQNASLKSKCANEPQSGCVGLVLLFGGDPQSSLGSDYSYAESLDKSMWRLLQGLGQNGIYFRRAINRNFINFGGLTTEFELNIYVFKKSLSTTQGE
jgi:hypothetical protein